MYFSSLKINFGSSLSPSREKYFSEGNSPDDLSCIHLPPYLSEVYLTTLVYSATQIRPLWIYDLALKMREIFNTADLFSRCVPLCKQANKFTRIKGTTTIIQMLRATFAKKAINAH